MKITEKTLVLSPLQVEKITEAAAKWPGEPLEMRISVGKNDAFGYAHSVKRVEDGRTRTKLRMDETDRTTNFNQES